MFKSSCLDNNYFLGLSTIIKGISKLRGDNDVNYIKRRYIKCIFSLLGAAAKCDSCVNNKEIEFYDSVLKGIKCEEFVRATEGFECATKGYTEYTDFTSCFSLLSECGDDDSRKGYIALLVSMCSCDGIVNSEEEVFLFDCSKKFYVDKNICMMYINNANSNYSNLYNNNTRSQNGCINNLFDAYNVLECEYSASKDEVKIMYIKKISECDQNKIQEMRLSKIFVDLAKKQSKKINEAYSIIIKNL